VVESGGTIINERVNGMLAISRAFGDHQLKKPKMPQDIVSNIPEITSTEVTESDMFVILACDGLWDVCDDQEAVNLVLEFMQNHLASNPGAANDRKRMAELLASVLIQEALKRQTTDNITCLLVFL